MKKWLVGWLIWMAISPAVTFGAAMGQQVVTLEIPAEITVSGPQLDLFDLGVIRSGQPAAGEYMKQVELGMAPAPGQQITLNRDYVNSILNQYRFPFILQLQMGETVVVKSSAVCLESGDVQKAIDALLTDKKPNILKRWVELRNIPDKIFLSPGPWKTEASFIGNPPEVGPVLFKVTVSKGTESRVLNISGKIRATALVYRALRDLPFQSVLNPADFETVEIELENGKEFLGNIQSGIRSTKLIKQGEILKKDWLQPVPLVARDQQVKVIVKDENVAISILGTAKADGWLGDDIMITNPLSHKVFKAKVTGNGTVELNMQ